MKLLKNVLPFVLWIGLTLGGLAYFHEAGLKEFDPHARLHVAAMSSDFDQKVTDTFSQFSADLRNRAFHILSQDCHCNLDTELHVGLLDARFKELTYSSETLWLESLPPETDWLPSAPAIVVFDDEGKLAYLGPYSSGYYCLPGESLVDRFLNSMQAQLGPMIISDSRGCYCRSESSGL